MSCQDDSQLLAMHLVDVLPMYTMSELLLSNRIATVPATILGANLLLVNEHSVSSRGVKSICQSVYLTASESIYTALYVDDILTLSVTRVSIRHFDTKMEARNKFSHRYRGWRCATNLDNTLMEPEHLFGIHCLQAKQFSF